MSEQKELKNQETKNKDKDFFSKAIDKSIDFIFSKDSRKWVLLLFIIAFIVRTLLATRVEFGADEMVHGTHAIGFIESGKLQIMDQDAVWFWLTDLSLKTIGSTLFGLRFLSILLGSLSVILVYLIGKEMFSKKVGLIAAFVLAVSPFQFSQTVALMDIPMSFFAFFAVYLLIKSYKTNNSKLFYLAWISLGIAIMIKQIAILFIPALGFFHLYYNKKNKNDFKIKPLIYAAILIILMVLPVLTFNYLLFKDKGITDIQFARFTQKGLETYAGIAHTAEPFSLERTFVSYNDGLPGFIVGLVTFYNFEPLIVLLFAAIGLFFLIKSKTDFKWLLLMAFLFPYLFLAGTSLLANHLIFGTFFTSLLAGLGFEKSTQKLNPSLKKYALYLFIIITLILVIFTVQNYIHTSGFFGKHHMQKVIEFKQENIEDNALVVVDSRIYRGRNVFMFHDKHYLEATNFVNVLNQPDAFTGQPINVPIYFLEALTDDSGWGTIKDQPEFNQSMEQVVDFFKSNSQELVTYKDIWGQDHYRIYKTQATLKSSVLEYADSTHVWFFYPVGYQPVHTNFDHYETYNTFDLLLDKLAHLILYLEVFISFLLVIYLCYLFYKSY
jgi:hypothetical protein